MPISRLNFNDELVETVYMNGELVDEVYMANEKVYQRLVPAGSEEFLVGAGTFTVPKGVTQITACVSAGGGGGGAGRGGGGGGAGAVSHVLNVTPLDELDIYVGAGGLGSDTFFVRGESGEGSIITSTATIGGLPITVSGGQGGISDGTALGGSGGGAGGDGLPPSDGGDFGAGCGGSYTGGVAGASTGGGGAGGWGNGRAGGGDLVKVMAKALTSAGGGGVVNGLPSGSGYRGGEGGDGKCVISWVEQ